MREETIKDLRKGFCEAISFKKEKKNQSKKWKEVKIEQEWRIQPNGSQEVMPIGRAGVTITRDGEKKDEEKQEKPFVSLRKKKRKRLLSIHLIKVYFSLSI